MFWGLIARLLLIKFAMTSKTNVWLLAILSFVEFEADSGKFFKGTFFSYSSQIQVNSKKLG